jgi:hypothetical protein
MAPLISDRDRSRILRIAVRLADIYRHNPVTFGHFEHLIDYQWHALTSRTNPTVLNTNDADALPDSDSAF